MCFLFGYFFEGMFVKIELDLFLGYLIISVY